MPENNMADDHINNLTVTFNVGGKFFKTARSLTLQHEGSLLARLVSDTWQVDKTKPIFIDTDGDTFRFVSNYLRYGRIALPVTEYRRNCASLIWISTASRTKRVL
jgi:hypothetical protein